MLAEQYEVEVSDMDVYNFLKPYMDTECSEFLTVIFYIDETNWEGEVNGWKDKIIFKMFSELEKDQKNQVFAYMENNDE